MAKKYNYTIIIKRQGTVIKGIEQSRQLNAIKLDVTVQDDPMMINKKGMTGNGYKMMVTTLVDSISEISRVAAQQGFSEGEIIRDVIDNLSKNLIDAERKAPTAKVYRK